MSDEARTINREKLWHVIAREIACEEECQKQPEGCGCARNAADAVFALLKSDGLQ